MTSGSSGRKVCIIGGGISGLATAYLLTKNSQFTVDLIETEARLGGAAYTMQVKLPDGTLRWVDMGVNDFNATTYTKVVDVMGELNLGPGVGYRQLIDEESFSRADTTDDAYTLDGRDGTHMPTELQKDFEYFKAHARTDADTWAKDLTVAQYLADRTHGYIYNTDFGTLCIFPRVNGMYFSTDHRPETIPLIAVMHYYELQEGYGGKAPKRMYWVGGTLRWIGALEDALRKRGVKILTQTSALVTAAAREGRPFVTLIGRHAHEAQEYDVVVFAGHAKTALKCISNTTGEQKKVLGNFTYLPSTAYAHIDPGLLPPDRKFWRTYNILIHEPGKTRTPYTISYVVNFHQNDPTNSEIRDVQLFFCTLNPHKKIQPECILTQPNDAPAIATFPHNVVNAKALKGQQDLWGKSWIDPRLAATPVSYNELPHADDWGIQGSGGIFFTGGWTAGAGLHEQCWKSAEHVCTLIKKIQPQAISP